MGKHVNIIVGGAEFNQLQVEFGYFLPNLCRSSFTFFFRKNAGAKNMNQIFQLGFVFGYLLFDFGTFGVDVIHVVKQSGGNGLQFFFQSGL